MIALTKEARERLRGLAAFFNTYCSGLTSPNQGLRDKARSRKNNAAAINAALAYIDALEAERDAALAEVERMRPVVEAADAAHLAAARVPIVNHQQEYISALADLWLAVESYRAKEPDHA